MTYEQLFKQMPQWFNDMFSYDLRHSRKQWDIHSLAEIDKSMNDLKEEGKESKFYNMPIVNRFINGGNAYHILFLGTIERLEIVNEMVRDSSLSYFDVAQFIMAEPEDRSLKFDPIRVLKTFIKESPMTIKDFLIKYSHHAQGRVTYSIRDHVAQMLGKTNIGNDLTTDFFQVPEERTLYIELGQDKIESLPIIVSTSNNTDGLPETLLKEDSEPLEGFYVSSRYETFEQAQHRESLSHYTNKNGFKTHTEILIDAFGAGFSHLKTISLLFHGRVTKDNEVEELLNTGFSFVDFHIPVYEGEEREINLQKLIDVHFDLWRETYDWSDNFFNNQKELTSLAIVSLLYINSTEFREKVIPFKELKEKVDTISAKKRRKLETKLSHAVDRIYIGHSESEADVDHKTGSKVRLHYRRGHFKGQRYGKGNQLKKVIWIKPTLVGKDKTEEPILKNKVYT